MKKLAASYATLYIKIVLLFGICLLPFASKAQSFMNFTSFNNKGFSAGADNNYTIFAGYGISDFNFNIRNTFYPENVSYQFVQFDAGYDFNFSDYFKISPRVYFLTNYKADRTSVSVSSDFEFKYGKWRLAYSVYAVKRTNEQSSSLLNKGGVYYQATKNVALYAAFGPDFNFLSYDNQFFIGPVFTSGKLAARIQYHIDDKFNPKYSGLLNSISYNF